MSRLIDADALIAEVRNGDKVASFNYFLALIQAQPTAYDIEKVVAELKEKKDEAGIIAGLRSTRVGEDEYEEEPYHEGKKHAYGHAIEVVRKGGAE